MPSQIPAVKVAPAQSAPDSAHQGLLADILDAAPINGLALDKQPTGWVASLAFEDGHWSPLEFAVTPSDAIRKALRLHGSVPSVPAPVLAPPPY